MEGSLEKRRVKGIRLQPMFIEALTKVSKKLGMYEGELIEHSLIDYFKKIGIMENENKMMFKGMNLVELLRIGEKENLRDMLKRKRKHMMSKHYFTINMKKNLLNYMVMGMSNKDVIDLFNTYHHEAEYYEDNKDLLKLMNNYKQLIKQDSELRLLKSTLANEINEDIGFNRFLKEIHLMNKKYIVSDKLEFGIKK